MIHSINLSGEWDFSFEKPVYNDHITLPSTTALSGKGGPEDAPCIGHLTERYPYTGTAFFRKQISVPEEYQGKDCCLKLERTRMSRLFINGADIGECCSLTTPHRYYFALPKDSPGLCIELQISNTGYPTPGGHMTSPDTQTNWLGILGEIQLEILSPVHISYLSTRYLPESDSLMCYGDIINNTSEVQHCSMTIAPSVIQLEGLIGAESKNYDISAESMRLGRHPLKVRTRALILSPGVNKVEFTLDREDMPLWSEHNPQAVQLDIKLTSECGSTLYDAYSCYARLCSLTAGTHDFFVNGVPVKLRGKHDGLLFPVTGAAPMEVSDYLKVMGTALRYGINHYRYHTCCPPEAAFTAADLLGIIMEPELPFWGTVAAPGEEGYNEAEQNYLMDEARHIMKEYGNHPSFGMFSLGNELWGSKERVSRILRSLKSHDDRFLFTQGSNNFQFIPEIAEGEDFFVGARLAPPKDGINRHLIRGSFATCDAPLGVIQTGAPSTRYSFDEAISDNTASNASEYSDSESCCPSGEIAIQYQTGVKYVKADGNDDKVPAVLPIVSHEVGQYCMYPDFKEIEKYSGVLRAGNLELFRDNARMAGMEKDFERFFAASGALAVSCYREELEMMHRSRLIAGYQLLDLQDYTGQNTSLVGVLNSFMESKGLISEEEWRRFCSDEVLSASFDSYIYTEGDEFHAKVILSHFNPLLNLSGRKLCCEVLLPAKTVPPINIVLGRTVTELEVEGCGTYEPADFSCCLLPPKMSDLPLQLLFRVRIIDTPIMQEYRLYLYPAKEPAASSPITTDALTAKQLLEDGHDVLFFPEKVNSFIPGFYCTDFWNYPMFRQISESVGRPVAVGTLGLCIDNTHPALKKFISETYSTPQWYNIVSSAKGIILDGTGIEPVVQIIDNTERCHRLGLIFEARTYSGGRLLICSCSYDALRQHPEGRQLIYSLSEYVSSGSMKPDYEITKEQFDSMFP